VSRRWRYPRAPRGRFLDYPKPDRTPPSSFTTQRLRRGFLPRRGQFLFVPPTAVIPPAAPAYPPGFIRQAIRRALFGRRGSYAEPPWTQPAQPPAPVAVRRRTTGLARRGTFQWVPPAAPIVGAPGPLVQPSYREAIRRGFTVRRGQFYEIPLVGGAPLTPATWPPPIITARRHRTYPARRRVTFPVPVPQLAPVLFQTCRRKPGQPARRGRYFQPPWPQVVTAPPVYPPQRIVARRRPIPRPRGMHCRFFEPGWPQAVQIGVNDANGRVVVTQTVISSVDAGGTVGLAGITQTSVSTASGSSTAGGGTRVDPTADGRAEVG